MKEAHEKFLMACGMMTKLKAAMNKGHEKELSYASLEHEDCLKCLKSFMFKTAKRSQGRRVLKRTSFQIFKQQSTPSKRKTNSKELIKKHKNQHASDVFSKRFDPVTCTLP